MCENIDWNVGRLLDGLERLGVADNTIVAYFCDNGPNGHRWNGGMKGVKGSTDEGGVRSPLLILWPGHIEAGKQVGEISGAIDLLPTLADLAGVEIAGGQPLDGVSLKSSLIDDEPHAVLEQAAAASRDRLLFSHWNGNVSVRSSQFRMDHQGRLYDIAQDPGQTVDLSSQRPELAQEFRQQVMAWRENVLSQLDQRDRPFDVGYGGAEFTQLPARDGHPHGGIVHSSRHPNCSFFTDWKSVDDAITWEVQVHEAGEYEATLYYTCAAVDVGSTVELSMGESRLVGRVADANDPPLLGAENDRVPRTESYVKAFAPLTLGTIELPEGGGVLTLKALNVAGEQVMDLRLLMLRRIAAAN
jgi:hypothetical protein